MYQKNTSSSSQYLSVTECLLGKAYFLWLQRSSLYYTLRCVGSIDSFVFYTYNSLKEFCVPESGSEIYCGSFCNCSKLSSVELVSINPYFEQIKAFYSTTRRQSYSLLSIRSRSYIFPITMKSIANNAFCDCNNILNNFVSI